MRRVRAPAVAPMALLMAIKAPGDRQSDVRAARMGG
jgi:hypothetical protein